MNMQRLQAYKIRTDAGWAVKARYEPLCRFVPVCL